MGFIPPTIAMLKYSLSFPHNCSIWKLAFTRQELLTLILNTGSIIRLSALQGTSNLSQWLAVRFSSKHFKKVKFFRVLRAPIGLICPGQPDLGPQSMSTAWDLHFSSDTGSQSELCHRCACSQSRSLMFLNHCLDLLFCPWTWLVTLSAARETLILHDF